MTVAVAVEVAVVLAEEAVLAAVLQGVAVALLVAAVETVVLLLPASMQRMHEKQERARLPSLVRKASQPFSSCMTVVSTLEILSPS